MGRIVECVVTQIIRKLELTREDVEKQIAREAAKSRMEVHPAVTRHEQRFAERLARCPVCGKTPRYLKTGSFAESGYEYKFVCGPHSDVTASVALECGNWYSTPSKAGLDWNKRAAKAGSGSDCGGMRCAVRAVVADDLKGEKPKKKPEREETNDDYRYLENTGGRAEQPKRQTGGGRAGKVSETLPVHRCEADTENTEP